MMVMIAAVGFVGAVMVMVVLRGVGWVRHKRGGFGRRVPPGDLWLLALCGLWRLMKFKCSRCSLGPTYKSLHFLSKPSTDFFTR